MSATNLKNRLAEKTNNLQSEPAKGKVTPIADMTLTATASEYTALTTNALEIINENLKNQPLSHQLFDVVKAPSGGATVFTVPTMSGEEIQKELIGIILDYGTPRAYWESIDPVEGTPPDCYSRDSLISHKGESCAKGDQDHACQSNEQSRAALCQIQL